MVTRGFPFRKIIIKLLMLFTFLSICSYSYSQTAVPRYPINGDRVSASPKFTAIETSLVPGVLYNVVISEQPRGGGVGVDQYIDFWTKENVPASSLMDSNVNRLGWDSTWVRKTRNGSYVGTPVVIANATPSSLTNGKTYYWHIYGQNGTKSVENTFAIIDAARPVPIHVSPADGATIYASSQNPCFSWSMSNASGFSNYTIMVSTTPDFPTTRWQFQIASITTTSLCWNNGANWQKKGTTLPPDAGPLENGKTYYWRVLASYADAAITGRDFVGRSFVYRALSSSATSSSAISSSRSSSSSSVISSSVASSVNLFDFTNHAPATFNYPLSNSGLPSLGSNQLVATTQGNLAVNNGAANYTIDVDLPPAVRDLKPKLSLNYNSRSGNGLMGVGWSLGGLSAITRCRASFATEGTQAQKSNPRYSMGDRLCLDGQKLVVVSSSTPASDASYWAAGTEYKTELDNFAKIVAYGSSANGGHSYFKVWTKDGRILSYGAENNTQNSRIYAANQFAGPINTWALDKVEDVYGNNYIITYNRDTTNGDYYPAQINLGSTGLVIFEYQTRSGQTPWGYDSGNKYQFTKLLNKVTTYVGATSSTPIKQYDIRYKTSATTNRELVDKIYECGFETSSWKCAKPVIFDWQLGELGFETTPLAAVGILYDDFNNDGYVDEIGTKSLLAWGSANGTFTATGYAEADSFQIIQTKQGKAAIRGVRRTEGTEKYVDVYLSRMAPSAPMTSLLITSVKASEIVKVVDLNNDGLTDINVGGFFWIQGTNSNFVRSSIQGGISSLDNRVELAYLDVDGDGLNDQTYVEALGWLGGKDFNNAIYTSPNTGSNFVAAKYIGRVGNSPFVEQKTGLGMSWVPNHLAYTGNLGYWRTWIDINGDGNSDLLFPDSFSLSYPYWALRLSTGMGSSVEWPLVNTRLTLVPMNYTSGQYSFVMDYNKDGLDDLIVFYSGGPSERVTRVYYATYINGALSFVNSGVDPFMGKLDYLINMEVAAPEESVNPFRGDVNNDGIMDLVVNGQAFLGKQQQPDLINKITDGFGAEIQISYSPLSGNANNGSPLYTPDAAVPIFPLQPVNRAMQVVKRLSTSNGQNGFNHAYFNYSGGVQDVFRGFSGFKSISITNTATNVNSITEYRQDWPYIGRIKKQTLKDTSGKLISITDNSYALHPQNLRFSYLEFSLQKSYELSTTSDNFPRSVSKTINTFDVCGNLTEQTTRIGNGISGTEVTGEQSNQRRINAYDYYGTSTNCSDDFLSNATQEVSKSGGAGLKRIVTEFIPNGQREVRSRTDFKGESIQKTTTYERESNGVVNKITEVAKDIDGTDEPARIITFSNFAYGMYPQSVTNAENHTTTLAYDYRFGSVKTETFLGQTTTTSYDPLGRLQSQQAPDGTLTENITFYCNSAPVACPTGNSSAYYGLAMRVTHASQLGKLGEPLSIVFYDSLQREVRNAVYTLDGKAINQVTQYSDAGNVYRVSEPYVTNGIVADTSLANAWTVYSSYDALGRANNITDADGGTKTTRYATDGYGFKITDDILVVKSIGGSETQTSSRWVNALGQVVRVEDALFNTVSYSYDAAGNLENTQVNNNLATNIELLHDLAGNKTYIKDPDAGVINFEFNGFGELRKQIWQTGVAGVEKNITYDYDKLGRQTSRIDKPASGSTVSYSWVWDTKQQGQLSTRSGNGFHEEYFYDGFSRVSRQIVTTNGLSGGEFVYTYDNFSRPETVRYPNGFKIQRDYHSAGYQVQTRDITATARVLWALGNTVDTRGAFNNQLWGNGVATQTGLDNKSGRLTSIKSGRLSGTNTFASLSGDIQNLAYSYDSLGNLITRNTARTTASGSALENVTETFGYDKLNRVKTISTSGLFSRTQTFEYDTGGLGNLINRSDLLSGSSVNNDIGQLKYEQLRNAGVHAVTSAGGINYSYDKYGNMIARGSESITYDTFNKPTRIAGSSITDFYYGPDHELYKEISGTKTTYKLAGGMYEVIVDGSTTTQKSYVDGVILNNRVLTGATQTANDTVYLHTDHLGSVEATTNALGQFVNRMSFSAWGERQKSDWKPGSPTETFLTTNGFTGHDQLDNHNLIHMGGRVYDPNLGRFLSADIVVQSPYDSQSYNRYSYTFNNPLSYTDPTGYSSEIFDHLMNQAYSHAMSWMWSNSVAQSQAQIEDSRRLKEERQKLADYQRAGLIISYDDTDHPADYSETWSTGPISHETLVRCYSGPTGCLGRMVARQGMSATGLSPSDMMSLLKGLEHLSNIAGIAGVAKAVGGKVSAGLAKEHLEHRVLANKAAGDSARDAIAARTGGMIEQSFRVTGGVRRVDVLVDSLAIESKVGRTAMTDRVRQELARDIKLLRSGQVEKIRWEFSRSDITGKIGPTLPLRQKLEKLGVEIVENF